MKSKEEEFCRSVFSMFLERTSATDLSCWRPVPQVEEPPDYYLHLDDRVFAVEVTAIMDSTVIGGKRFSSEGLSASLDRFCKELEGEVKAEGLLNGLYALTLDGISHLSKRKLEIRSQVVDYLLRTQHVEIAPREVVIREGHRRITIRKCGGEGEYLEPILVAGDAKWEVEVREDLRRLLAAAVSNKLSKLTDVRELRILLLLDRYRLGGSAAWREAAEHVTFVGFHTVARIWMGERVQILYSECEEWAP